MKQDRIIYHIDVNSAFLSWEAVYRTQVKKDAVDLVRQLSEDKNIRKKLLMKLLEIESGE